MTQALESTSYEYAGSGSPGPFAFNSYIEQSGDLIVEKYNSSGAYSLLVLTTDYTLGSLPAATVDVTLTSNLESGEKLIISRKGAHNQESYDPVAGGDLGRVALELMLDRYSRTLQDLWARDGRSIKRDARASGSVFRAHGYPIEISEIAAPATPESGYARIYQDTTGDLHVINDAGTDTNLTDSAATAAAEASAAAASAAAALSSENAAATSASNAATSASNAATSETNAAASAIAAAAASETPSLTYTFDTGTTTGCASGEVRLNNAAYASVTEIYIHETAGVQGAMGPFLDVWDDSNSAIKGYIRIYDPYNPDQWAVFQIDSTQTDNGTDRTFPVTHVASNGSLWADGTTINVHWLRNGDAGTGAVDSWNARTGTVVPVSGDYDDADITASASATNYTPGGATVDGHLSGIDTALGARLVAASNLSDVASAATAFANLKQAASDTATGVVELATDAETQTGTDTARAITPANLTAAGIKQGKHTLWMPAVAMTPRTTNGAAAGTTELATNDIMLSTLDFDQTTEEGAGFMVGMPKSWNESTVTFIPIWTAASGSGGVVWSVQGVATSNDDALDAALGTGQTSTDTLLLANDNHTGPESSAITIAGTPAEGDLVYFEITREVADGSDTLTADAKLIGIKLLITYNAATDA